MTNVTKKLSIVLLGGVAFLGGCAAGNHSADEEAPVILTVDVRQGVPEWNIANRRDVTIPQLEIKSQPKAPDTDLGPQDDVILTEWVVTPERADGGTVASPVWRRWRTVTVPANGTATLNDFPIFPVEYFDQQPLVQLYPQNGGFDRETGKTNVRQRLNVVIYGKTVAGRRVTARFDYTVNFFYQSL
ncbi:MAG: hypothetical protein AB1751_11660 [Acidobacteriota bacterium]